MKKYFTGLYFILFAVSAFSQEESKHTNLNIEGQFVITSNGSAVFLNFGGPAVKFSFNKFACSLNFMPSLRVEEQQSTPSITPILGTGLQFYFLKNKRFILSFPCYYYANRNIWVGTAGLGYVLTKPKK